MQSECTEAQWNCQETVRKTRTVFKQESFGAYTFRAQSRLEQFSQDSRHSAFSETISFCSGPPWSHAASRMDPLP